MPLAPALAALLALAILACTAARPAAAPARTIAFTGATVIDGTGAPARANMVVVVRDGRIADVHPVGARPMPAGADVVDLAGRFMIPGLIDGHVHLATVDRPPEMLDGLRRATLMGGVTTLRDMGGRSERLARLARQPAHDSVPVARLYWSAVVAGPRWFATYDSARVRFWSAGARPGEAPGVRLLDADTDVVELAREARQMGATAIKVYSDVPPARLRALVAAAHAQGLRVWSHAVVPPTRPGEAATAGVDLLTHADQPVWETAPAGDSLRDRAVRARLFATMPANAPAMRAFLDTLKARGTLLEPTLFVMMPEAERAATAGRPPLEPLQAWAAALTREAHRAGVLIVAGTDALGGSTPNLHGELELLVRLGGLTPLEAIRAATQHGARALGIDSLGTIAPGMLADFVILGADPTADIRNTRTVEMVVKSGHVHRRERPMR